MTADSEAIQRYQEREQRLKDAIALRVPDRVPVVYHSMFWHAAYGGCTIREVMYDYDLAAAVLRKAVLELQPDAIAPAFVINALGPLLELLDFRQLRWPGHGVADRSSYQFIDQELMKAEEYALYLEDPSYFWLSRYLPRVAGAFEPLAKLPQFSSLQYIDLLLSVRVFADPDIAGGFARLAKVGAEGQRMTERAIQCAQELTSLGFPSVMAGNCPAPYDYFADFLRGSKGIMLDMFRRKDELLAAMDRVAPILIRNAVAAAIIY